jgi:hypothetical protein
MSFGLNIRNDTGRIAFSTAYQNYQFDSKKTLNIVSGNLGIVEFNVTSERIPLVFVAPSTDLQKAPYVARIRHNGGLSWTVGVANGNPSGELICYVFTAPNVAQSNGFGINVFNEEGVPTFTSGRLALKIAGFHVTSFYEGSTGTYPITQPLTSGVIPEQWASNSSSVGSNIFFTQPPQVASFSIAAQRASATQVRFNESTLVFLGGGGVTSSYVVFGGYYILFIDRTLYD